MISQVEEILNHGINLADIYEDNTNEFNYTSEEGQAALSEYFMGVPVALRQDVFQAFLDELSGRGYEYEVVDMVGDVAGHA